MDIFLPLEGPLGVLFGWGLAEAVLWASWASLEPGSHVPGEASGNMISNEALLGLPGAVLGASLGPSWGPPGPASEPLGAVLEGSVSLTGQPFWAVWGPLGTLLGCVGAPRG
eukprot:3115385-Pyramimonas_sp.AAC.1